MKKHIRQKKRITPVLMAQEDFLHHLMEQGLLLQIPPKREEPIDINKNKYKIDEIIAKYETNC